MKKRMKENDRERRMNRETWSKYVGRKGGMEERRTLRWDGEKEREKECEEECYNVRTGE
jgi:hypothetical protein